MKTQYVKGKPLTRTKSIDASVTGIELLDMPPRMIECNTTNTYRIYENASKYRNKYMYKGLEYDGEDVWKITDTSGNALAAGLITYVY